MEETKIKMLELYERWIKDKEYGKSKEFLEIVMKLKEEDPEVFEFWLKNRPEGKDEYEVDGNKFKRDPKRFWEPSTHKESKRWLG